MATLNRVPSTVFGKSSDSSGKGGPSSSSRKHRSSYARSSSQASLSGRSEVDPEWSKITRMGVQVDQGKRAISDMCQEMSSFLSAEDTHISEDEELIDYILRAVRICRMLMHENDAIISSKSKILEQAAVIEQECVRKLQEKDELVAFTLSERDRMKTDHYSHTMQLRDELAQSVVERNELYRRICFLETENATFKRQLDIAETKLLEAPRVEEGILKRAKHEIKLKEITLNKKEYKFKR
jgi:hypothetical protein